MGDLRVPSDSSRTIPRDPSVDALWDLSALTGSISGTGGARFIRSAVRIVGAWIRSFLGVGGVRVRQVRRGPAPDRLHEAICEFERSVPVGLLDGRGMTYHHSREYGAFFRSIQTSRTFAAMDRSGRVIGMMSVVALRLRLPTGRARRATFAIHLRVLPDCRFGQAFPFLVVRAMLPVLRYGGMAIKIARTNGTFEPAKVARSIGLPTSRQRGAIRAIAFACDEAPDHPVTVRDAAEREVRARFRELTTGFITSEGGKPEMRSAIPPRWVIAADGSACGCIEDNNTVVQWRLENGQMFAQSHLSFFGWTDAVAAGRFLRECIALARTMGITRLRILVDESVADAIIAAVGLPAVTQVRWRVFVGAIRDNLPDAPWVLHPSEI